MSKLNHASALRWLGERRAGRRHNSKSLSRSG